jgi:hypothetical protein
MGRTERCVPWCASGGMRRLYDNSEIKSAVITGVGESIFSTSIAPKVIQASNELNSRKFAESDQETFVLMERCHCANAAYSTDEDGCQTNTNSFAHCCKTDDLEGRVAVLLAKRALNVQRGLAQSYFY